MPESTLVSEFASTREAYGILALADHVPPEIVGKHIGGEGRKRFPDLVVVAISVAASTAKNRLTEEPALTSGGSILFVFGESFPFRFGPLLGHFLCENVEQELRPRIDSLAEEVWTVRLHYEEVLCHTDTTLDDVRLKHVGHLCFFYAMAGDRPDLLPVSYRNTHVPCHRNLVPTESRIC